jgi:hypothetical protein
MVKQKPLQRLPSFIGRIESLDIEINIALTEFTEWADKFFYGKNYKEAFNELIEDDYYELADLGIVQNGLNKKTLKKTDGIFTTIIYHDKNEIINTVLVERS